MAVYPGGNFPFTIAPRVTVQSGTSPHLYPNPDGFMGIFDGGSQAVLAAGAAATDGIYVATAPYNLATDGVSVNAARCLLYGEHLEGEVLAPSEAGGSDYMDVTIGGSDTLLNAVSNPHIEVIDYDEESRTHPDFPHALLGVPAGMDVGWIQFGIVTGSGDFIELTGADRRITTLTLELEASQVQSFTTGPPVNKTGRMDIERVTSRGTGFERVFSTQGTAIRLGDVPRQGAIYVTGIVILVGIELTDLDGAWVMDGRNWTLVDSEMVEANEARVTLQNNPRTRI